MSYCVNCGVELAPAERVCPLCGVEVCNPRAPYDPAAPRPFPREVDRLEPVAGRAGLAPILTLLMALPAAICLACDLAYTQGTGWSVLAAGALGLLWIVTVPMVLLRRHRLLTGVALDSAGTLGYLWLVERYTTPGHWFIQLAVPLVLLLALLIVGDILLITRVITGRLRQMAAAVASSILLLVGTEAVVDSYLDGRVALFWSLLVSTPCLVLALLLLAFDRRKRFKEQMKKRLHM
ncbi:MAG: hypothetical protein HFJ80_04360 [Clostridiales bacterium]|nr:hypothetical protein [Clostridiales bacterium]